MPTVFIPPPLRDLAAGASQVGVDARTVAEAIEALDRQFPGIGDRLRRGDALAPGLSVAVDHVLTPRGLRAPLQPDSEVHFLPAIAGG